MIIYAEYDFVWRLLPGESFSNPVIYCKISGIRCFQVFLNRGAWYSARSGSDSAVKNSVALTLRKSCFSFNKRVTSSAETGEHKFEKNQYN